MGETDIDAKVRELRCLYDITAQLRSKIEVLEDSVIGAMIKLDLTETAGADWRCTWKEERRCRVDAKAMQREAPELAARYCRVYTCRRLCVE